MFILYGHNIHTQPFYGPFSGTTRPFFWDHPGEPMPDFMVQGKINRGRHTDHPAKCHSIRTILHAGCPSYRPANSVKVLKA